MFKLFSKICILIILSILCYSCSVNEQEAVKTSEGKNQGEIKKSPKSTEPMSKKWGKVTIRFRMETQDDTYGFNIYRGESEKGPFNLVNKDIILGGGTTRTPMNYEYIDKPLQLQKTYYYYLEEVTNTNKRTNITGINPKIVDSPLTLKEVKDLGLSDE